MNSGSPTSTVRLPPVVRKGARIANLVLAFAPALLLTLPVRARAASDTTTDPNQTSTVATTFSASGGTPGSWVQAAIARHNALIVARVDAAQNGQTPGVRSSGSSTTDTTTATTTTATTSDTSNALASLSTLLSQYSSSLSSLDSLSSLLSSLTGTSVTSTATSKSIAAQKSTTSADTTSSTSTTTDSTTDTTSSSGSSAATSSGGAIARLPTASELYSTSTTAADDQPKFAVRLAESLIETFSNQLSSMFQSTDFIDLLKAQLEPFLLPLTQDQSADSTAADSGTDSSSTSDSSSTNAAQ